MKTKELCVVESQQEISRGIFSLWIKTDTIAANAVPGQFVSLFCKDGSRLLPRPISLCEIDKEGGRLHLVYRVAGGGTKEFSTLRSGEQISVMGPLGNGFPLKEAAGKKVFLMGGGIGVPPMLECAKQIAGEVQIILGYRDVTFLKDDFEKAGKVYIATEDGSSGVKGNVMDAVCEYGLNADLIFACGPKPMLRAIQLYAQKNHIPCWISMEERMACGVGACLGCVCKSTERDDHSQVNHKRVCKDGPVFPASEVDLT